MITPANYNIISNFKSFPFSDTFASQYDSDQEPWDEPLKRRFSSSLDVSKTTASTQTLIAVPFCRDPTQPVPVLPADEIQPAKGRPAVYKKKSNHSPQSYYQPPAPWIGASDDTETLENSGPVLRKTSFTKSLHGIDMTEPNPIKELQAMARSTNDMNDDEPPFNFQAMLKRTPRNRASMKRSGESESASLEKRSGSRKAMAPPPPVSFAPEVDIPKYTPSPRATPDLTKKYGAPTPPIKTRTPTPSRDFPRQDSRDRIVAELKRDNRPEMIYPIVDNRESEKIELAPGITIEGTVTDL